MACTILGIESSCDETAAAVVSDGHVVHSNVIATQYELHERYTGVVPEIASRPTWNESVPSSNRLWPKPASTFASLDAVAVGHRPGLIGSLLTGVSAAKALAWSIDRPLVGVDHLHAHLWSPCLDADPLPMPALGLVASGGHTNLLLHAGPAHGGAAGAPSTMPSARRSTRRRSCWASAGPAAPLSTLWPPR